MATILGSLVNYGEGPPQAKSQDPSITCSGDHVTNAKSYISTSTRPTATKLGSEFASDERILSMKSYNPLIMWTHQVTG